MSEYILVIIEDDSLSFFEQEVNRLLENGWNCQGGVGTLIRPGTEHGFPDRGYILQAMTKVDPDNEK